MTGKCQSLAIVSNTDNKKLKHCTGNKIILKFTLVPQKVHFITPKKYFATPLVTY